MKAEVGQTKEFRPIALTITLESEREVGFVYAVFNSGKLMDILGGSRGFAVREAIESAGFRCCGGDALRSINEILK